MTTIKILDLPLKKEWYDMIESGEKREEYREIKTYWYKRLIKDAIPFRTDYTHVRFRYGYTQRTMLYKIKEITIGRGNPNWGAPTDKDVFIIKFYKEASPIIKGQEDEKVPYGVICEDMEGKTRPLFGITPTQHFIVTLDNATDGTNGLKFCTIDCVKPYLRPMSSMTEEEKEELFNLSTMSNAGVNTCWESFGVEIISTHPRYGDHYSTDYRVIDWLNRNHFDYRGLIPVNLAIAVTEDNNPYKE